MGNYWCAAVNGLLKMGTMLILITLAVIDAMLITKFSIAEAARNVAKGTTKLLTELSGQQKED